MFVSMCWKEKPSYEKKLHQANLMVHAQLGHTLQIPSDAYGNTGCGVFRRDTKLESFWAKNQL